MENFFAVSLFAACVLAFLLAAQFQRQRWVKIAAALFAAITCVALAFQLRDNPAVALLLAVAAVWLSVEALASGLIERLWAGLKSYFRRT